MTMFGLKDLPAFLEAVASQVTGILNTLTGATARIAELTNSLTEASTENVRLADELATAIAAKAADNSAAQEAAKQAGIAHAALLAELVAAQSASIPAIEAQVASLAEKLGIDLATIVPVQIPAPPALEPAVATGNITVDLSPEGVPPEAEQPVIESSLGSTEQG